MFLVKNALTLTSNMDQGKIVKSKSLTIFAFMLSVMNSTHLTISLKRLQEFVFDSRPINHIYRIVRMIS